MINKIISGGQTGTDRAALDWAISQDIPHGGWVPKGRKAEDGRIDDHYNLQELTGGNYRQRTKLNVQDSDGTLIVNLGSVSGGTLLTKNFAEKLNKPFLIIQADVLSLQDQTQLLIEWLRDQQILILNVAGPRESKRPGVYLATRDLLDSFAQENL